ncbi:MAG TPA: RNA 3'-terminal phosphate cyclase [Burkholderiaceae bacterium]|nr:RNA 3'-terminal phosphate cyclase [Burkholderiaceae bacterium]
MIEIDASQGEGGGQVLRTSLALSMYTGQAVRLRHIRARRPRPGLMRQHLACVHAAQAVSGAQVQGAELGSATLRFQPGPVKAGEYRFSVGSAGSCTLVLQTVWPALLQTTKANAGASRLVLEGGTHNPMAPPYHFIERCYAPLLRRLGAGVDLRLRRHGFYPAGGGAIEATLVPAAGGLKPFDLLERGPLEESWAELLGPALPEGAAGLELQALADGLGWPRDRVRVPELRPDEGPGHAVMATLRHAHISELATGFGDRRRGSPLAAEAVVQGLRAYQAGDAVVGPYLADQWALPLALAVHQAGQAASYTCTELSEHTLTNFGIIERFLPVRFGAEAAGAGWRVTVR